MMQFTQQEIVALTHGGLLIRLENYYHNIMQEWLSTYGTVNKLAVTADNPWLQYSALVLYVH